MAKPSNHPDPLKRLLETMAQLRGEEGCPWDREQTHESLIPFLIEEAYEFIEAVEACHDKSLKRQPLKDVPLKNKALNDQSLKDGALAEELGDLLLQVIFHAQIASERGAFSIEDVALGLNEKLVERHDHVFGADSLQNAEEVAQSWHDRKMEQRSSALDGIPSGQPALQWARQVGSRAARTGFEWHSLAQIFEKIEEELEEVRQEIHRPPEEQDRQALEIELGDLLFVVGQLARWVKVDPETALRQATRKFINRFQQMEKALHSQGKEASPEHLSQWQLLWDEAKKNSE